MFILFMLRTNFETYFCDAQSSSPSTITVHHLNHLYFSCLWQKYHTVFLQFRDDFIVYICSIPLPENGDVNKSRLPFIYKILIHTLNPIYLFALFLCAHVVQFIIHSAFISDLFSFKHITFSQKCLYDFLLIKQHYSLVKIISLVEYLSLLSNMISFMYTIYVTLY